MRVSTLELFFDLVFVFTITQVTRLVSDAHGVTDLLRAFLVLAVTWWMYDGYAWLTNNVGTERTTARISLLVGMGGFLVMALATPRVADRDGLAFGLSYLVVVIVHAAVFIRAPNSSARAMYRVAPFNVAAALLVAAAGLVPARWNLALWIAALLVLLATILAIGVAVYLSGDVLFRHVLRLGPLRGRVVAAMLALATAPVGLMMGHVPQLSVLIVTLAGMLILEERGGQRRTSP